MQMRILIDANFYFWKKTSIKRVFQLPIKYND